MRKHLKKIMIILVCLILILPNLAFAETKIDTDKYDDIYSSQGTSETTKMGGSILAVVQVIGISVGIIFLIILGIKYMTSAPNEKATIKERLIPYAIGAVIMFGGTGILSIVAKFAINL